MQVFLNKIEITVRNFVSKLIVWIVIFCNIYTFFDNNTLINLILKQISKNMLILTKSIIRLCSMV